MSESKETKHKSRVTFLKEYIKNLEYLANTGKPQYQELNKIISEYKEELFELETPLKNANIKPKSRTMKIEVTLKTGEKLIGTYNHKNEFETDSFFFPKTFEWNDKYIENWKYI